MSLNTMRGIHDADCAKANDHSKACTCPLAPNYVKPSAPLEAVDHPAHYGGDTVYEVLKVIMAWGLGFNMGNIVKYIARASRKDSTKTLEDLKKARFYLDYEITRLEGESK